MVIIKMANCVDPDKMAHYEPYHLALHCLPMYLYRSAGLKELIPFTSSNLTINLNRKYLFYNFFQNQDWKPVFNVLLVFSWKSKRNTLTYSLVQLVTTVLNLKHWTHAYVYSIWTYYAYVYSIWTYSFDHFLWSRKEQFDLDLKYHSDLSIPRCLITIIN